MAPQVASLSELSRIRGDAEVRYPCAITEPKLSPPGLDRDRETMIWGGCGVGRGGGVFCKDREVEKKTTRK